MSSPCEGGEDCAYMGGIDTGTGTAFAVPVVLGGQIKNSAGASWEENRRGESVLA